MRANEIIVEVVGSFIPKSAADLEDLENFVTNEEEEIDSVSTMFDNLNDPKYKQLEKDYRALMAVHNVITNNIRAFNKQELLNNNIFIYDYEEDSGKVGAIHVQIQNNIAEIKWLGSYGTSGRQLLIAGLTAAKAKGIKKYKLTAKWNSEGFYRKMGLQQHSEPEYNVFADSNFTDFAGDIPESTSKPQIIEGLSHPVICVDAQPAYAPYAKGKIPKIIEFVNRQTGPVLMFVNAERDGLTDDTVQDIITYWDEVVLGPDFDYNSDDPPNKINWSRFTIDDKGYGWFRSYMDYQVDHSVIIKLIRYLYTHKYHDVREIIWPETLTPEEKILKENVDIMHDEPFSINWTSVAQLKKFNGAYIVGGGRDECLREVELLMNAFNIKYKRIDSLVY